jgi:hypothetical protein
MIPAPRILVTFPSSWMRSARLKIFLNPLISLAQNEPRGIKKAGLPIPFKSISAQNNKQATFLLYFSSKSQVKPPGSAAMRASHGSEREAGT